MADDHALFRAGVAEILATEDDIRIVGEAANSAETLALAEREHPNVILLDVEMPLMGAERTINEISRVSPASKVLVLTVYDEPRLVRNLLASGARGYLVKNATRQELIAAVRSVHRLENKVILSVSQSTANSLEGSEKGSLTGRELEVLLLTVRAMSNSQIASHLHISEGTVKRHLTNIYTKLEVSSRADAAKKALTSGLITFRDLAEPDP